MQSERTPASRTELQEASLSRVWRHFNDDERALGILTAFRGEYSYEENVSRNKSLAADIRNLGYGFFYVDGYWIENQGTSKERAVKEDSIFVIGSAADTKFRDNVHALGNDYDQEAVVVKDGSGTNLIFNDGTQSPLGKLLPGQLGSIYTRLRNNKKANTFVFEHERDDPGFVARLAKLAGIKN